jgi:hypothetical protein
VLLLLNWVENFLIVKISFFKLSRISRLLRLYWELRLYGIKTVDTSFLKHSRISWLLRCCSWNCWEFFDCHGVVLKLSILRIEVKIVLRIEVKIVLRIETLRHQDCRDIIFETAKNFIDCWDVGFVTVENFLTVVMLHLKLSRLRIKTFGHWDSRNVVFETEN